MDESHDQRDAEDEEEGIFLDDGDNVRTDEEAPDDEQSGDEEGATAHAGDGASKPQTGRSRKPTRNSNHRSSKKINTAKKRANDTGGAPAPSSRTLSTEGTFLHSSSISRRRGPGLGLGEIRGGEEGMALDETNEDEAVGSAPNTYLLPRTGSSIEQAAFFRALSVYSRWRPDLVAACVPTKSVWEVGMYLEALEEGAARLAMEDGVEEDDNEEAGQSESSHSDSDKDEDEDTRFSPVLDPYGSYEPSYEVSQAWIDAEEVMASWTIGEDYLASLEKHAGNDSDGGEEEQHEPPKRKRGRPPHANASSTPPTPSLTHKRRKLEHEREVLMSRLEERGTRVGKDRSQSRGRIQPNAKTKGSLGDGGMVDAFGEVQAPQGNEEGTGDGPSNLVDTSNAMIDPVLLALSEADTSSQPIPSPQLPSTLPSTSNVVIPRPDASPDPDLTLLSPRSRRRLRNRLYMRQRRAVLRGDSIGSEGARGTADKSKVMGMEQLRPEKKAEAERGDTPNLSTPVPSSGTPSDTESKATNTRPRKSKSSLTLPYKLKAEVLIYCIWVHWGRLMGLYTSLEYGKDDQEEADERVSPHSIDATLLHQLQAAVVWFVTDVVHRAIVWREREIRLKKRSQAWRHADEIGPSAIEHAIHVLGARYHSHKQYFTSMVSFYGLSDHDDTKSQHTATKHKTSFGFLAAPAPVPLLHQDIYTPVIRPPSAWGIDSLNCSSRTYMREATRTRRGGSQDIEEELMPDETDDEVLEEELRKEDELDRWDMKMAEKYEQRLWAAVGQRED
ncbi:hypothetical protein BU15DRAFT_65007 [Melanogaster broomeanus]|nr:hypothetical protein BU15DRAFT_65007 [Melanogaster broomeanus]